MDIDNKYENVKKFMNLPLAEYFDNSLAVRAVQPWV